MNHRHAFHAGNHTEVFKHAALMLILDSTWRQKPQGFVVLDDARGARRSTISPPRPPRRR